MTLTPRQSGTGGAFAFAFACALSPILAPAIARAAPPEPPKPAADPTDDNTRVRSLFRKAAAASQAAKYEEARQLLLAAWAIRQTYDVASSLAQVELQLKLDRDAAEHLEFCIRNFAPVESEQTLDQAKAAFADVKTRVASVRVSADRKAAEIFVDGVQVGSEPMARAVFVEPGVRRITARLQGQTAEEELDAQPGREYVADLKLSGGEVKAAGATAQPVAAPPAALEKPSYVPAIVTTSVGVAALATGVVLLLEASHKDSQRSAQLAALGGANPCGAGSSNAAACDEISSLDSDARTFRTLSVVGFGAAAAAGVATYFLWPRASSNQQLGMRAMALPSHGGVDLFAALSGAF
ncbi:MAG TPA: hypothetical protein VJV79_21375 [Polyangiaceae bacterium]|nr:hypothetical protein [Polyangiaceae bacterium]